MYTLLKSECLVNVYSIGLNRMIKKQIKLIVYNKLFILTKQMIKLEIKCSIKNFLIHIQIINHDCRDRLLQYLNS